MTIQALYIYANIYILFFWVFYKVFLKLERNFQSNRLYLNVSMFACLVLPYFQYTVTGYLSSIDVFTNNSYFLNISYLLSEYPVLNAEVKPGLNWTNIILYFVLSGSTITFGYFLYGHIQIWTLIKKSEVIKHENVKVILCSKSFVPFIFNNLIIIPRSIPPKERHLIIHHEFLHYKFSHHIDNYLLQVFQIIFWINPAFYLLKRELKQVHEYQVDWQIISSGIDVSLYKLALIKFSVGNQKFALANGLSNYKIKNRIVMMNNINIKKGNWKFLLLFPAICIAVTILSFTNAKNNLINKTDKENLTISNVTDSVTFKLLSISELENEYQKNTGAIIPVFINFKSQLMIKGKKVIFQDVPGKVGSSYESTLKEKLGEPTPDIFDKILPDIKVIVQKDVITNKEDYNNLLNQVGFGIYMIQEKYSNKIFGEPYKSLSQINKEKMNMLIQLRIFIAPDKKMSTIKKKS